MSNYTKSTNFATKDNLSPGDPLKIVRGTEIDTEFNNISTAISTKTDNSAAAITGGSIAGITDLAVADGGTGASTATAALNNLLPSQTGNANKYLQTDGTNASWDAVSLSTADITGTLPVANGGTGVTSSTGTGSVVLSNSPTLVTPALGTPASGVATNLTGLPISTGVSGLGTGVATFLGTPSSANLASAVSDETGTGSLVFANSPTLVTPALGTPSALVGTNITGTASGLTAGNVTTNANLTGAVTSVGNATSLGSFSSANLLGALTDETGTGSAVFATSPTLVTPILGTPTSATLTNATGLPIATGVSGLGTGVATFLATPSSDNLRSALTDETGTGSAVFATSPTLVTPVLGTPTSATLTNATGLPLTTGVTGTLPTANGGTGLTSFTSGGVVYASSTSALATGSALSFNGTNALTVTANSAELYLAGGSSAAQGGFLSISRGGTAKILLGTASNVLGGGSNTSDDLTLFATAESRFYASSAEGMRLTSTGLGIGTSSPAYKLDLLSSTSGVVAQFKSTGNIGYVNIDSSTGTGGGVLICKQNGTATSLFGNEGGILSNTSKNTAIFNDVTGGAINLYTNGSATVKATLDSAGNLGLGVTPSAWGSNFRSAIQGPYGNYALYADQSNYARFGLASNAFHNGTAFTYVNSSPAAQYQQFDGVHRWFTAASGTAGDAISFTQAMTLDASGNLGVGTTSPQAILDVSRDAEVLIQARCTGATGAGFLRFKNGGGNYYMGPDSSTGNRGFATGGAAYGLVISSESAYPVCFGTNNVERARIDSSGNLLVGTTSIGGYTPRLRVVSGSTQHGAEIQANNSGYYAGLIMNTATSGDNYFLYFGTEANGDSQRGSITYNRAGGLTAYNTTSDYRAKDISGPVTGSGALIDSVPVYMGTMKGATQERPMFIAHEVPAYAHTGEKDAVDADGNPVYQQMDASALIPVMWAEIQSLRQRLSAANL